MLFYTLTRMQYSPWLASTDTEATSASSAVASERKKLVWQSSWHVNNFCSVNTRQQGTQGVGATPGGMTCKRVFELQRGGGAVGAHRASPLSMTTEQL